MPPELTIDSTSTTEQPAAVTASLLEPSTSTTTPPAASLPAASPAPPTDGATLLTPAPAAAAAKPEPTPEEAAATAAHAELFGVPEGTYEIAGLPEGTVIDTATLSAVEPVARELGLSNAGMSKLAAVYADKVVPALTEQVTNQILAQSAATTQGWATETIEAVRTDAAYGGKPLAEVQAIAAKALDRFGGPEFREYLKDTGLGNHPAMMRAMFLAGSAIAEDTTFERGSNVPPKKTREEKYYPAT